MNKMCYYLYEKWPTFTAPVAIFLTLFLIVSYQAIGWIPFLVWIQLVMYLLHEHEEYVYPGGFRDYFNTTMFPRKKDILSNRAAFCINSIGVWCLYSCCALLTQHVSYGFGIITPVFSLCNGAIHIANSVKTGKYNPGLITSVGLFYPVSLYTIYVLYVHDYISLWHIAGALFFGIGAHVVLIIALLYAKKR